MPSITPEQIEAAHSVLWERDKAVCSPATVEAALNAALSVEAQPGAVKPLAFDRTSPDGSMVIADSVFGEYWAWEINGTGLWSRGSLPGVLCQGGISKAIAAAQADYSARILSALTTPPAPAASEPVKPYAWLCNGEGDGWKETNVITRDQSYAEQKSKSQYWTVEPLYRGHPAPAPAVVWRTMDSAPRDGTAVFLWNAKTKSILRDVRWVVEEREGNQHPTCIMDGWKTADMNAWACYLPDAFSHWMLPYKIPCPCDAAAPAAPTPQTEGGV